MAYSEAMKTRALASFIVFALSLAACGSDTTSDDNEGDGSSSRTIEVTAQDFAFQSDQIVVDPGEEVSVDFNNSDGTTHTFTIEEIDFDIEAGAGADESATFTAPDEDSTLVFFCRFHPTQMKGTVQVGTGGTDAGSSDDGTGEGVNENDDGLDY